MEKIKNYSPKFFPLESANEVSVISTNHKIKDNSTTTQEISEMISYIFNQQIPPSRRIYPLSLREKKKWRTEILENWRTNKNTCIPLLQLHLEHVV